MSTSFKQDRQLKAIHAILEYAADLADRAAESGVCPLQKSLNKKIAVLGEAAGILAESASYWSEK